MITLREAGEFSGHELPPEGLCHAVCYAVIDLGKQQNGAYPPKWRVLFCFELAKRIEEGDAAGQRFGVFRLYTNTSHEKSALMRDLTSWLGRMPDPGQDLEELCIGRGACLNIRHKERREGNNAVAAIVAVNPPLDGFETWVPENGRTNSEWKFPRFASRMRNEALEHPADFPCDWDQLGDGRMDMSAEPLQAVAEGEMPPF